VVQPFFFKRRFFPIWLAFSLAGFNDNMLRQSLIIAIGYGAVRTGFAAPDDAIPIVGALFAVASLSLTSIAGQVAEKFETSLLLRRIKLAELALLGVVAAGFASKSGLLLMAAFVAYSAQAAFFSPARTAALPKYLKPEELVRANAYCNAGMFVCVVFGLFLGGVLVNLPGGGLIVSGLLIVSALAAWLGVRAAPLSAGEAPDLRINWNPIRQSAAIIAFAFAEPGVWRPLVGVAMFFAFTTMTGILMPLLAIEELGANGATATTLMGLSAIGASCGAVIAASLTKRRTGLSLSCIGMAVASLASTSAFALTAAVHATGQSETVLALASHWPGRALLAAFFVSSACIGVYLAPLQAAAQRRAPAAKRARTLAAGNLMSAGAAMLGSLSILAITKSPLRPADGLLVLAALQATIAAYMLFRWFAMPRGLYDGMLAKAPA
jgi:MFS family permease